MSAKSLLGLLKCLGLKGLHLRLGLRFWIFAVGVVMSVQRFREMSREAPKAQTIDP